MMTSDEHHEQAAFIQWCDSQAGTRPELGFLYANVNGAKLPYRRNKAGKRYSPEAQKLIREGLRPGVPDLFFPVARGGYHGLYLETKYGKNKTTIEQDKFIAFLRAQGYRVDICYGFEALREATEAYLDL